MQRYWSIIDRFSEGFLIDQPSTSVSAADRATCRAYLALCEDEADLYSHGRITQETWEIWKAGLDHSLQADVYRDLLEQSSSEQYAVLRQYIADGDLVPKYRGAKAKLHGLT